MLASQCGMLQACQHTTYGPDWYLYPDSHATYIPHTLCKMPFAVGHRTCDDESCGQPDLLSNVIQEAVCAGSCPSMLAAPQCIVATVAGWFGACCTACCLKGSCVLSVVEGTMQSSALKQPL